MIGLLRAGTGADGDGGSTTDGFVVVGGGSGRLSRSTIATSSVGARGSPTVDRVRRSPSVAIVVDKPVAAPPSGVAIVGATASPVPLAISPGASDPIATGGPAFASTIDAAGN